MKLTKVYLLLALLVTVSFCFSQEQAKKASQKKRKQESLENPLPPLKHHGKGIDDEDEEIDRSQAENQVENQGQGQDQDQGQGETSTAVSETVMTSSTESTTENTELKPLEAHQMVDDYPEAESNTLLEIPLDYTTNLSYYYPYFYKTHLISLVNDIDLSIYQTTCSVSNCGYCDNLGACARCYTGYFLFGTVCDMYCPDGYIADNLRMLCVQPTSVVTEVYSFKAYSVGSCSNMCGNVVEDCSCTAGCKASGNCCSDYDSINCPSIFEKNSKSDAGACAKNAGCKYCDDTRTVETGTAFCNQCNSGLYNHNGRCVQNCPEGYLADSTNMTCYEKPPCNVNNCSECAEGSSSQCKRCKRGSFLFDGSCPLECPSNYNADRITWTCLEPPVFAWYWVYPSRTSCKTHCGVVIQEDWDCSCSPDCFRFGNCCQDIDDYCPSFIYWRKSSNLRKANRKNNNNTKPNANIKALPKDKNDTTTNSNANTKTNEASSNKAEVKEKKKEEKVAKPKEENFLKK